MRLVLGPLDSTVNMEHSTEVVEAGAVTELFYYDGLFYDSLNFFLLVVAVVERIAAAVAGSTAPCTRVR